MTDVELQAVVRSVNVPRPGHAPVVDVLAVFADDTTVCPTCRRRVPLRVAVSHLTGAGLPMADEDDETAAPLPSLATAGF